MSQSLTQFLDDSHGLFAQGRINEAMMLLWHKLNEFRLISAPETWKSFCENEARSHEISNFLLNDPFTSHSFLQPAGYPGDAGLLDYIYGMRPLNGTSGLGQGIFAFTINTHGPAAVRFRRKLFTEQIDHVSAERVVPKILSLACGHLREVEKSIALAEGRIGEIVGLDQDAAAVANVNRMFTGLPIRAIHGSIRSLLSGRISFSNMDLVYAAGLFDYLGERTAIRLARMMFNMLMPGGRMLIANFAPSLRDIGYMEAFMRWHLIYRDAAAMERITHEIPEQDISDKKIFWDDNHCMAFLEITRK